MACSDTLFKLERDSVEYQLRGKTLKVYLYILKAQRAVGVREVQRNLSFSSPSIAFHHLEKLVDLGVVLKNQAGEYELIKKVDVGVLQAFSSIAGFTLPRLSFYAVFFTVMAIAYLLLHRYPVDPYALISAVGGAAVLWFETLRTWRKRPF
jgi:predicted DNA-binding transcriptional regulator